MSRHFLATTKNVLDRDARKMNLWWNYDIMIHETSVVKKVHFRSTSVVDAKKKQLYNKQTKPK